MRPLKAHPLLRENRSSIKNERESLTKSGVGVCYFQAKSSLINFQTLAHQISILAAFLYKTHKQPSSAVQASFHTI